MYHVFTAKSLMETGEPVFPGGAEYHRALPFSFLVAVSFKIFGVSELSARLPSVIFALLFIVTSSLVIRRMTDGYTATVYAMIIGLSPFALQVARQCRMYTMFNFFFFFSIMLLWIALTCFATGCQRQPSFRCLDLFWKQPTIIVALLGAAICLFSAFKLHLLAVSVGAVVPVFCLGMLIYLWLHDGWKTASVSVYSVVFILCIAGAIALFFLIDRQRLVRLITGVFALPNWATFEHMRSQMTASFYRYYLQNNFPALFFTYPIAVLWLIKDKPSLGILSLAGFTTIFLAHSYGFPLKQERYIFQAFPFFALPSAFFIRHLIQESWERMRQLYPARKKIMSLVLSIAFAGGVYVYFYPWLAQSKAELGRGRWTSQWKEVAEEYRPILEKRNPTIITTSQNHFYHYFGKRPDFYMRASYRPGAIDAEYYLNSETIYTLEQLTEVLNNNTDVILITEFGTGNRDYFTAEMGKLVNERMVNIYSKTGFMRIYETKSSLHGELNDTKAKSQ